MFMNFDKTKGAFDLKIRIKNPNKAGFMDIDQKKVMNDLLVGHDAEESAEEASGEPEKKPTKKPSRSDQSEKLTIDQMTELVSKTNMKTSHGAIKADKTNFHILVEKNKVKEGLEYLEKNHNAVFRYKLNNGVKTMTFKQSINGKIYSYVQKDVNKDLGAFVATLV